MKRNASDLLANVLVVSAGLFYPFMSGWVSIKDLSPAAVLFVALVFILCAEFIWIGSEWLQEFFILRWREEQERSLKAACHVLATTLCTLIMVSVACASCKAVLPSLSYGKAIVYESLQAAFFVSFVTLLAQFQLVNKKAKEKDKDVSALQEQLRVLRLEKLVNELHPHFVFNSLSVLLETIESDKDRSKKFLTEFIQVLKYFHFHEKKELVPVKEEMNFLESYFYLQQTRFGQSICLQINNGQSDSEWMIPPFALQLLVENAIKHNVFSGNQVLHIRINIYKDHLMVINTFRPKMHVVGSWKKGLSNLVERYQLLGSEGIGIYKTDREFIVKLPLIKTAAHEQYTDHRR